MVDLIGKELGRYRLVEKIGGSSQGEVYRGIQEELNREVAVRVLLPEQARDSRTLARFRQESRTTAQLSHPHILTVYDSGKSDHLRYLVMELLAPDTLAARLRKERQLPLEEALRIGEELAAALEYMHARKLLHGMLILSNIRFDLRGNTIATGIGTEAADRLSLIRELSSQGCASPEILLGEKVGPSSDLYQLGVILYAGLCGGLPYSSRPPFVAGAGNFERLIPSPRSLRKEISPDMEKLVLGCLRTNPSERPPDATSLRKAILKARRRVQVRQVSREVAARNKPAASSPEQVPTRAMKQGDFQSPTTPATTSSPPLLTSFLELLTGGHGDLSERETQIRLGLLAAPLLLLVLAGGLYLSGLLGGPTLRVLEAMHEVQEREVTVSWKSNRSCYAHLEFFLKDEPCGKTPPSASAQTLFRQSLSELSPGTHYQYQICLSPSPGDAAATCGPRRAVQTRMALSISDASVIERKQREVTLRWRTNRAADTRVRFWKDEGAPTEVESPEYPRDQIHEMTLRGLLPGSRYHYRLLSREPGSKDTQAESPPRSFTTKAPPRKQDPNRDLIEAALNKLQGLNQEELSKLEASLGDMIGEKQSLNMEKKTLLTMTRTLDATGFFRRRRIAEQWVAERTRLGAKVPEKPSWSPREDLAGTLAYLKDYFSVTKDPAQARRRLDECIRSLGEIEGLPLSPTSP
jgi:serine/threonine protein kinase